MLLPPHLGPPFLSPTYGNTTVKNADDQAGDKWKQCLFQAEAMLLIDPLRKLRISGACKAQALVCFALLRFHSDSYNLNKKGRRKERKNKRKHDS